MSDIRNKMAKKKSNTSSVVASMVGIEPEPVAEEVVVEAVEGSTDDSTAVKEEIPTPVQETAVEKPETVDTVSVITFKQVPDEKKSKRKNMLFYPTLCAEVEQIAKEQNTTFNDLVNTLLLDFVAKNPSKKSQKKKQ